MTRSVRAPLSLLVAVALVGCSSGSHPAPTVPPSAPTTVHRPTTSTTAILSLSAAAARYKGADDALEAALRSPRARLTADAGNLTATKADYQALADAYRQFDRGLRSIGFPKPPASQVAQLLDADMTLELYLQAAADAASPGSLASDQNSVLAIAQPQLGYRNAVRQALGLAPLKG